MTTAPFDPHRSVASLTMAELEAFIRQTMQQTEPSPPKNLTLTQTNLDLPFDQSVVPFWEVVAESRKQVPDELWATIPEDASEQIDHYLYHA